MEDKNTRKESTESAETELSISESSINYLKETSKWTKFLSIVGFVFIGLIVIMALFAGSIFSSLPAGQGNNMPQGFGFLFGFIYLLIGLLYFFPTWYLFNFSKKLKLALIEGSNEALNNSLSNQKSFYKFWGILMIVMISIYVFFGMFAGVIFLIK